MIIATDYKTNKCINIPNDCQFIRHNLIKIDEVTYKIQFYTLRAMFNSDADYYNSWNKNCGKVRTKRYIHLNKRLTTSDKIDYLYLIAKQNGVYLLKI